MSTYLKVEELRAGAVYRLHARNIAIGVYDGHGGFIGIRNKFGNKLLATELHYDTDDTFGTAKPLDNIRGWNVPSDIPLTDMLDGSVESKSGRPCEFDRTPSENGGGIHNGQKVVGWVFSDNRAPLNLETQHPVGVENARLFSYIELIESVLDEDEEVRNGHR